MRQDYVLLITSTSIGKSEEKLGKKLMASYLHCLHESEDLPSYILFLHEGVKLVVEDTPVLALLQNLAGKGVKILACGTCLDYFQIKDQVKVGEVGNMYGTRDILAKAGKVITIG